MDQAAIGDASTIGVHLRREQAARDASRNRSPACPSDAIDALEIIDRFNAEKFAHLITQLDSIDEGDGGAARRSAVQAIP